MSTVDAPRRPRGDDDPRRIRAVAHVGAAAGAAFATCFLTGLISHFLQHPTSWFAWPTHPVWLFRLTQGLHVATGFVAVPLVLVKLGLVYRRLFVRPPLHSVRLLVGHLLERVSIGVLVGACLFQLVTGVMNVAQWYPWPFFFPDVHYAVAYLAIGALAVHIAVKLPLAQRYWHAPPAPVDTSSPLVDRRTAVTAAAAAAGVVAVGIAGQSVTPLRPFAFLSPRSGRGPQRLPVNRTAVQAGIAAAALDPDYRLTIAGPDGATRAWSLAELRDLPQTTATLPIACVEGWSVGAEWTGVRLSDLLRAAGTTTSTDVRVVSLEPVGGYRTSVLPAGFVADDSTLLALRLNGDVLDLDHGYPCRLIAPNRPGVLQTKWVGRIEVLP